MPILSVEIVGGAAEDVAQKIAEAVGEALGSEPGTVWVSVRRTEPRDYAENGGGAFTPVIVRVLLANATGLHTVAEAVSRSVAAACERPVENVHVVFEPPGEGRVAFGGKMT